jgi:hypothetical protein
MRGDVIGPVALDLVLRRVRTGATPMTLVVEVTFMNPDDRAADATGFRVPRDPIADLERFSHSPSPTVRHAPCKRMDTLKRLLANGRVRA